MLRLVSDENFNGDIVRGLFRRHPELELVRVQDVGLMQTPDPDILEWAASQGRKCCYRMTFQQSRRPRTNVWAMVSRCLESLSCPTECRLARPLTRSCFSP